MEVVATVVEEGEVGDEVEEAARDGERVDDFCSTFAFTYRYIVSFFVASYAARSGVMRGDENFSGVGFFCDRFSSLLLLSERLAHQRREIFALSSLDSSPRKTRSRNILHSLRIRNPLARLGFPRLLLLQQLRAHAVNSR